MIGLRNIIDSARGWYGAADPRERALALNSPSRFVCVCGHGRAQHHRVNLSGFSFSARSSCMRWGDKKRGVPCDCAQFRRFLPRWLQVLKFDLRMKT